MRRFNRVLLGIAGSFLSVGLVLALLGWAMGGQTSMEVDVGGHKVNVGIGGFYSSSRRATAATDEMGSDALAAFDKLDVDISLGDVNVVPSDHFGIKLYYYGKNYELHYENENGTLKVRSTLIPTIGVNLGRDYDAMVTVYLPEGTRLKDITVKAALGDIDLYGFAADKLDITANLGRVALSDAALGEGVMKLDLGDLDVSNTAADSLNLMLSMGNLEAHSLTTGKEFTVENNMGDINVQGDLAGKIEVNASMGDVTILAGLPERDYGYELSTGMGDVKVNGEKRSDGARREGGIHSVTVDNGMGDISLDFE